MLAAINSSTLDDLLSHTYRQTIRIDGNMPSIASTDDKDSIASSPTISIFSASYRRTTDSSTDDASPLDRVSIMLEFALVTVTEIRYWFFQDDNISRQSINQAPITDDSTMPAYIPAGNEIRINFLKPQCRTDTMDSLDLVDDPKAVATEPSPLKKAVQSLGLGSLSTRKYRSASWLSRQKSSTQASR